jgi:hypothetical protein
MTENALADNQLIVHLPVIIGFDDFLPFQNFTLFPSSVLSDLALVIRVSPMHWCGSYVIFSTLYLRVLIWFLGLSPTLTTGIFSTLL